MARRHNAAMRKHLSETTSTQRFLYGLVAGVAAACWPAALRPETRALLGWTVGAFTYLGLAWWLAETFDEQRTRARAQEQDPPSVVVFMVMLLAVLVSVGAIAVMLQQVKGLAPEQRPVHIALSMLALVASWLTIHMVFAFRYAHRYYQSMAETEGPGLQFPGGDDPDYFDFLYYSYVVGMTSQVSDVQVCSRAMRRLTLVHGVLAFAFNMAVLALSINVVAGAMQ